MNKALIASTFKLLLPLIRILLRNGISYGVFSEISRRAFVEVAERESALPGKKQTLSRISVVTGIPRKEVSRLKKLPGPQQGEMEDRYNRAARVIGGWIRDENFLDSQGRPGILQFDGPGATFSALAKKYSGDVPARTVLNELIRVGAVENENGEGVKLLTRGYFPKGDEAAMLDILGSDVRDLIATIDHNIRSAGAGENFFQRKVSYDNLPSDALPKLRLDAGEKAQLLLEDINRWCSQMDRDCNPDIRGIGRKRAGFGIFYFEEDFPGEEKGK